MSLLAIRSTLSVIAFQLLLLTTGLAKEPVDQGLLLAKEMEKILKGLKDTQYQSKTEVDASKGIFRGNCSGLITHLLRHHFPESYLTIRGKNATWRARPLAVTYYETFTAANEDNNLKPGWRRVRKVMDAKPGDLIAWRKLTLKEGLNTGHIVMVVGKPKLEADGRIKVRVADSTSRPHANDTRPEGTRGVGAGDMWFAINELGEPTGFWLNEKSKLSKSKKIAIGRLATIKAKAAIHPKVAPQIQPAQRPAPDSDYLGLTKAGAIELATKNKIEFRIILEEGVHKPVSKTISKNRVNFIIEGGKVIRTIRG